jgi:hypothetical protein
MKKDTSETKNSLLVRVKNCKPLIAVGISDKFCQRQLPLLLSDCTVNAQRKGSTKNLFFRFLNWRLIRALFILFI